MATVDCCKEFKPVLGFIRTTEVTHGKDGNAHPHFHALLLVPSSMFGEYYVKHARWLDLWRECMRDDSIESVDIRTVKSLDKTTRKQACSEPQRKRSNTALSLPT